MRDEADEEQQAIFQRGADVGKLAEQLFPGGVDARLKDTYSYQQSVADTARYKRRENHYIRSCFPV
ncbi:MAG: hypothetical protein V4539_19125 [Bacteroidota bacterium]